MTAESRARPHLMWMAGGLLGTTSLAEQAALQPTDALAKETFLARSHLSTLWTAVFLEQKQSHHLHAPSRFVGSRLRGTAARRAVEESLGCLANSLLQRSAAELELSRPHPAAPLMLN